MAVSLRELGRTEESLQTIAQGLAVFPDDPELNFHTGYVLTSQGRYQEAKNHYCRIAGADISGHYSSIDIGILGFKTFHNLGSVCLLLGNYEEAKAWWLKAMVAAPRFTPSICELFAAALKAADRSIARQMLEAIQNVEGVSENWATMGVDYAQAFGDTIQTEEYLKGAIATNPEATGPRLVWARRLLQNGREEEAMEHLAILNESGVAEAAFFLGVAATRRGEFQKALSWMERALVLSPDHQQTQQQIAQLKLALT